MLHDPRKIYPFKPVAFELDPNLTIGEMTEEQWKQTYENWIRAQFGWLNHQSQPHISLLLNQLDELREQLKTKNK